MADLVREIPLANGLTVKFFSHTRRYYGDFHLVKLELFCEVPLSADYFADQSQFAEAVIILGDAVSYRRVLEKMGVPASEVGRVEEHIITNFREHSRAYFAAPAFPRKLVLAELAKASRKKGFPPSFSSGFHD